MLGIAILVHEVAAVEAASKDIRDAVTNTDVAVDTIMVAEVVATTMEELITTMLEILGLRAMLVIKTTKLL